MSELQSTSCSSTSNIDNSNKGKKRNRPGSTEEADAEHGDKRRS